MTDETGGYLSVTDLLHVSSAPCLVTSIPLLCKVIDIVVSPRAFGSASLILDRRNAVETKATPYNQFYIIIAILSEL